LASSSGAERTSEAAAHELVMNGVSDVLLNIEHALSRAKKAKVQASKYDEEVNAKLALDEAIVSLDKTRKRLMQDAYYRQEALRLL
jgi:ABC-type nitrate/sulfonate/bicarbonate transport system ATPase subunit